MYNFNREYIIELTEYIKSGAAMDEFVAASAERKLEILSFLEKLKELGKTSDREATRMLFKKTQLGEK